MPEEWLYRHNSIIYCICLEVSYSRRMLYRHNSIIYCICSEVSYVRRMAVPSQFYHTLYMLGGVKCQKNVSSITILAYMSS